MQVSPQVHPEVSLQVSQSAARIKESTTTSPGPYLARSGSVYIFQIKVPKEIVDSQPLLRISLGARPHRQARRLADLLAAQARLLFDDARRKRMTKRSGGEESLEVEQLFTGESPEEVVTEMRGSLKAYLRMIDRPDAPLSAEELYKGAGIRDLVRLHQELAKQAAGEAFEELIVENADLITQKAFAKLETTTPLVAPVPPSASVPVPIPASPIVPQVAPPLAAPVLPVTVELDEEGRPIPAFRLDRRKVQRKASTKPLFSVVAANYIALRETARGKGDRDVRTARARLDLFLELIGDHPVDTYSGTDLQAYIELMQYWPGDNNQRDPDASPFDVIENNRDLHLQPVALKTLKEGYVSVVKSAIRSGLTEHDYQDPFAGAALHYPSTSAAPVSAEPLSSKRISEIFRIGVEMGKMHYAMLPLLGHLTGRRLGLLVHLTGHDFREKFDKVWVAQTAGIMNINGRWKRVPFKTDASMTFFVLHEFLKEIGFIDWAVGQDENFIFPGLMKLKDPSKSGSSYMQRLFEKAGVVVGDRREVFHSLRGGNIEDMRDAKVDTRDRKLQAGHQIGADEHELYGFRSIPEKRAREIAKMPLNADIDYTVFKGLDFDRLAANDRAGFS